VVDPEFLTTLSKFRLKEGLVEVLKMALVRSKSLYSLISDHEGCSVLDTAHSVLQMLDLAIRAKMDVVLKDESEGDLRKILNFGHTTAHALESVCGYTSGMTHGKAVAFGILVAEKLSKAKLGLENEVCEFTSDWIGSLYRSFPVGHIGHSEIWRIAGHDKKRSGEQRNFVLLAGLHSPIVAPVTASEFRRAYTLAVKEWSA
jgi:3-dehydroquinate synthase